MIKEYSHNDKEIEAFDFLLSVDFFETNPFAKTLLYLDGCHVLGYLTYLEIYDKVEVANVEVAETYRNQRIASKLMEVFLEKCSNASNITLEVCESNKIAQRLYQKYGFITVAKRNKYYDGEDGLLMERKLKKIITIGVPMKYGCGVEGAEQAIDALKDCIPFSKVISVVKQSDMEDPKKKYYQTVCVVCEELANTVHQVLDGGDFPLTIGGDHSIAIGSIAGSSAYGEIGVLWIDSHGDINNEYTTETGNIHGFPLSVSFGIGPKDLVSCHRKERKVNPKNIVIFGHSDVDPEEFRIIEEHQLKTYSYDTIQEHGIHESIADAISYLQKRVSKIHLSFDIDSINPSIMTAVNVPTRAKKGFTFEEAKEILSYVLEYMPVQSIDIVEYNPLRDPEGNCKKMVVSLCEEVYQKIKRL